MFYVVKLCSPKGDISHARMEKENKLWMKEMQSPNTTIWAVFRMGRKEVSRNRVGLRVETLQTQSCWTRVTLTCVYQKNWGAVAMAAQAVVAWP